jgi:hypothetical protein
MEAKIIFMASDSLQRSEYLTTKHDSAAKPRAAHDRMCILRLVILAGYGTRYGSSWRPAARLHKRADANAAIDNRAGGIGEITFEDC